MSNNFITNTTTHKTVKGRINTILTRCDELKFLVGFFYFSGWQEIYENLKKDSNIKLKILIGLQVEQLLGNMIEHGFQQSNLSQDDIFAELIKSFGFALNNQEMDNQEYYTQVEYFLKMMEEGRLEIRKTKDPNHAKLYLFHYQESEKEFQHKPGMLITGSSNLTKAGLQSQDEFNVEITDYGFPEAVLYFDELWEKGVKITEIAERKKYLTEFIQNKTQIASVTPFEAYVFVLKTYLELQQAKVLKPEVEDILENIGYKKYQYQLDAVNQALHYLEEHNGVIIADVVGLGKSVIASLIAKNLGTRGMVICPPGLIGDKYEKTGWYGYLNDFQLHNWEVHSRGQLEKIANSIDQTDMDVVIIDEAHYFRNQDTADYELLSTICNNRKVILLTATPFNNSPSDFFSLLKLFILPGKSAITLGDNLEAEFASYTYEYKKLSDILKNYKSKDEQKKQKAQKLYSAMVSEILPINPKLVRDHTKVLAAKIKNVLEKVMIRRNRLDLKKDAVYSTEVIDLSIVNDPEELFYYFTPEQSKFYNEVISVYFNEKGRFKGAIYQPFIYEKEIDENQDLDLESNRKFQQQRNLYDFMRRLLVKRFESSFGSFAKSIGRFIYVHKIVRQFIDTSYGKFIMDRGLIEKIINDEFSDDEIEDTLEKYANDLLSKKVPKNNTVYDITKFKRKKEFLKDIDNDIKVFEDLQVKMEKLNLVDNDPKRERIAEEIKIHLKKEPNKKIILFSEYVDTVHHLEDYFKHFFGKRVLVCDGKISATFEKELNAEFNAQHKGHKTNHFDILITSDRLSEGFNLNRAGTIINYDIPWNPTRVIQRVGRINRIGQKVFDHLSILNFFPSEIGADIVKSREIAEQKMFLIHSSLGEDAKIFDTEEEPSASNLYKKVNQSPDEDEEVNLITKIRNIFKQIEIDHPEIVSKINSLPNRVKTAKEFDTYQLNMLRRKGFSLFAQMKDVEGVKEIIFEEFIRNIECGIDEEKLELSENFWSNYEELKIAKQSTKTRTTGESLETKALGNLKTYLKLVDPKKEHLISFAQTLIQDIKNYHSLSSRTLGRLGRKVLINKSGEKELKAFEDEVIWIRNIFKDDYLDILLKRAEGQNNEVIIAIENQLYNNLSTL